MYSCMYKINIFIFGIIISMLNMSKLYCWRKPCIYIYHRLMQLTQRADSFTRAALLLSDIRVFSASVCYLLKIKMPQSLWEW